MNISPRQVGAAITLLLLLGAIAGFTIEYTMASSLAVLAFSLARIGIDIALLVAYWRGWRYAPYATVITVTVLILIANVTVVTPDLVAFIVLLMLLPPAIAMVLLEPAWVFGVAAATFVGHAIAFAWVGLTLPSYLLLLYVLLVGSMILGRLATASAVRRAEASAQRAEEAREYIAEQRHALMLINQEQETSIAEQRKLVELVAALETPAVTLADDVILAPIVGHLDARRAERLAGQLLRQVYDRRTRLVILDIAGVTVVDSQVARALENTARAVQLLGCQVVLCGISAQVAATLISQQVTLDGIVVVRSPQEALAEH